MSICFLCMLGDVPLSDSKVVTLTYVRDGAGGTRLVLADREDEHSCQLCENCIRDIKRIPLTEIQRYWEIPF